MVELELVVALEGHGAVSAMDGVAIGALLDWAPKVSYTRRLHSLQQDYLGIVLLLQFVDLSKYFLSEIFARAMHYP